MSISSTASEAMNSWPKHLRHRSSGTNESETSNPHCDVTGAAAAAITLCCSRSAGDRKAEDQNRSRPNVPMELECAFFLLSVAWNQWGISHFVVNHQSVFSRKQICKRIQVRQGVNDASMDGLKTTRVAAHGTALPLIPSKVVNRKRAGRDRYESFHQAMSPSTVAP